MRSERRQLASYLAWTTALVAAVTAVIARYFFLYEKSAVWGGDGLAQHYPALYAFNVWVREAVTSLGSGVPLWSWTMGLGADIIGTLSWPVLGDPFALVSLAFPMSRLEWAYALMLALRVLAAGITSALYIRKMGARPVPAATGVVLYVFVTFLLFQGRHPYFINAMVFLPLLLLGIEMALRDKKAWPLTVFVLIAAVANFYFFYMITLVSVLYAIARYFELASREERWGGLLPAAARVGGFYLLGIALAAPLLLPSAAAVLGTARSESEFHVGLFYPLWVYKSQLVAMASSYVGARSTFLGFGYLAWLMVPVLFLRRGRYTALKFMIAAFAVFVALPAFGSLFNGLTFPSNRFAFSWGLFLALGVAMLLSEDEPLSRRDLIVMAACFAIYTLPMALLVRPLPLQVWAPMIVGAATLGVLAFESLANERRKRQNAAGTSAGGRAAWAQWALLGLVVFNVVLNGTLLHDPRFRNMISGFEDPGVQRQYDRNLGSVVKDLPADEFYRVENTRDIKYNSAMVQGFPGTAFYYSTMDGDLTEFRRDIESRPGWSAFTYDGFDDRAMPTTLVGTKYYLARRSAGARARVPYGFRLLKRAKKGDVYVNDHALPLGFLYENAIDRSDFERLDPVDRQAAMLAGAVVDDGAAPEVPRIAPARVATEVPFSVSATDGATVDLPGGRIVREKRDSKIVLSIPPITDAELYVELRDFDNVVTFDRPKSATGDGAAAGERDRAAYRLQPDVLGTAYTAGRIRKGEGWRTPESPYYWGNRTQLVNLGYQRGEVTTITIAPQRKGILTFDSLKVFALPMDGYPAMVEALRKNPLRDLDVGRNRVSGRVSAPSDSILFLSIPYSEGWSATVDGVPTRVLRANTGFSGVPVTAGEHTVVLRYFTPGLKAGLLVAGLALVGIAVALGATALRRRRAEASMGSAA